MASSILPATQAPRKATVNPQGLLKVGEASALFGVSIQSLRNWSKSGQLKVFRTVGGHRLISRVDLERLLGIEAGDNITESDSTSRVICLARTSGRKQAKGFDTQTNTTKSGEVDSDLARQVEVLKQAAKEKYGVANPLLIADVGSALCFTRKGFSKLMKEILAQKHRGSVLLITFKDRLVRWGYEMVEWICEAGGVAIDCVSTEPNLTDSEEMAQDLLNIVHLFSCKSYARRGALSNSKELSHECLARAKSLYDSGLPIQAIVENLRSEGHTATKKDGTTTKITRHVLEKFLLGKRELVEQILPKQGEPQNSFLIWKAEHLVSVGEIIDERTGKASRKCRLRKKDLMSAYNRWYARQGKKYGPKLSAMAIARHTKEFKRKLDRNGYACLCGCQLKD